MVVKLFRTAGLCLILVSLSYRPVSAQVLTGAYSHVTDSDGTHPGEGKVVTLTLRTDGRCHLEATDASGQNATLRGDGTCAVRGNRITISLPVLELSVVNQPYTLDGEQLTLPFMVFNEGAGNSKWRKVPDRWTGAATAPDNRPAPQNAPPPPPPPPRKIGAGMSGELLCTCTKQSYDKPVDVLPKCTRPSLGQAMCGGVLKTTEQPCPVFRTPNAFTTLYNQAVLGRPGPLTEVGVHISSTSAANPKNPHTILVGTLISTFYKPWGPSDFYMTVQAGGKDAAEYAHVEDYRGSQHYLVVRGAAFTELSPAGMIASIGHEMIHAEQLRRPGNRPSEPGLSSITAAMNELEASTWETAAGTFRWKIGPNPTWSCETTLERDRSEALRACRAWQVQELIVAINQKPAVQAAFEKWLSQNPWATATWLRSNPRWKEIRANSLPPQVSFSNDPDKGMDCRDLVPSR
jgi:hypothetical protein